MYIYIMYIYIYNVYIYNVYIYIYNVYIYNVYIYIYICIDTHSITLNPIPSCWLYLIISTSDRHLVCYEVKLYPAGIS